MSCGQMNPKTTSSAEKRAPLAIANARCLARLVEHLFLILLLRENWRLMLLR